MASLTIPETYEDGFIKLAMLESSVRDRLIEAVSTGPMVLRPSILSSQIASKLDGSVSGDDLEEIIEALASVYYISEDFEDKDQFGKELVRAIEDSLPKGVSLPEGDREHFTEQLSKLLDIDSLRIASKALFLQHEYAHAFCSARVMTDIRPIFGSSPEKPPKAALIVHTLRLSYHEGTDLKHFYIAMDSDELAELMYVLDRADSKAGSLKTVLDAANLPRVDLET